MAQNRSCLFGDGSHSAILASQKAKWKLLSPGFSGGERPLLRQGDRGGAANQRHLRRAGRGGRQAGPSFGPRHQAQHLNSALPFLFWEGSPKIDYRKKCSFFFGGEGSPKINNRKKCASFFWGGGCPFVF